jgi:hypothetical protein
VSAPIPLLVVRSFHLPSPGIPCTEHDLSHHVALAQSPHPSTLTTTLTLYASWRPIYTGTSYLHIPQPPRLPLLTGPHLTNMSTITNTPHLPRRTSRNSVSQQPCRSSRIEKPKSHHNSPMVMERRKTTTETKLYATLDDHYRMMFGIQGDESEEERPQSTRPLSWHPSSSRPHASHQDWSLHRSPSSQHSPNGSDFYSLSTRNSMYDPMPSAYSTHRGSDESDYTWQSARQPRHLLQSRCHGICNNGPSRTNLRRV